MDLEIRIWELSNHSPLELFNQLHELCIPDVPQFWGVEFGIFGPSSVHKLWFFWTFPSKKCLDFFFPDGFFGSSSTTKTVSSVFSRDLQVKFFATKWCLWQRCPHGFKQLLNFFPCLRCLWRTVLLGFVVFRNEQQNREQMDLEKWCVKKVVFGDAWNCFCDLSVQQIEGICNSFNWSLDTIC